MPRQLLRQAVTIATGIILASAMFVGVGRWRASEDARWCRQAVAGGATAGNSQPSDPKFLSEVRSACVVQRARQRLIFGAIWRRGGQETARCGFELVRMQLISYQDHSANREVLQRYGVDDTDFDPSNRANRDRFLRACLWGREPR